MLLPLGLLLMLLLLAFWPLLFLYLSGLLLSPIPPPLLPITHALEIVLLLKYMWCCCSAGLDVMLLDVAAAALVLCLPVVIVCGVSEEWTMLWWPPCHQLCWYYWIHQLFLLCLLVYCSCCWCCSCCNHPWSFVVVTVLYLILPMPPPLLHQLLVLLLVPLTPALT